jgi:small subunit ribosomal protein S11
MTEELKNQTATPASGTVAAPAEGETKVAKKVVKRSKKNVAIRQVGSGRAYVKSTYNNTIVTFTDQNGNVLSWSSAGQCGFKGPKKATHYAASIIVKDAYEKAKKYGLKEVSVFVRGIGGGRESAIRALNANGLIVGAIKDITPIPHNGCRPPRPRRV